MFELWPGIKDLLLGCSKRMFRELFKAGRFEENLSGFNEGKCWKSEAF